MTNQGPWKQAPKSSMTSGSGQNYDQEQPSIPLGGTRQKPMVR